MNLHYASVVDADQVEVDIGSIAVLREFHHPRKTVKGSLEREEGEEEEED